MWEIVCNTGYRIHSCKQPFVQTNAVLCANRAKKNSNKANKLEKISVYKTHIVSFISKNLNGFANKVDDLD